MNGIRKRSPATSATFLAVWLLCSARPVAAHQGEEERQRPAAAAQSTRHDGVPPTHDGQEMSGGDMANMEMSGTEMAWPTGDGAGMMKRERERPATFGGRVIAWLGAWHPAVIHFPIALPVTVALLELLAWIRRKPLYVANNQILLAVGVAGSLVAASVGWAGAGLPSAEDDWTLAIHRWLGSAIPFVLLLLWNMGRLAAHAESGRRSRSYCIVLAVTVVIILTQGFLGGEITHGANHMAF